MLERKSRYGFTLIELMVVVAIIGILMSAGIIVFTQAQVRARDAKRIADVDAIAKLMEQYYQENGQYFIYEGVSPAAGWQTGLGSATRLGPYLAGMLLPVDPQNITPYRYLLRTADRATLGNNTTFCVSARLETTEKANCTEPPSGVYSCPFTSSNPTHYCVQNRQ